MALTTEPLPRNANGKVIKRQLREALGGGAGLSYSGSGGSRDGPWLTL